MVMTWGSFICFTSISEISVLYSYEGCNDDDDDDDDDDDPWVEEFTNSIVISVGIAMMIIIIQNSVSMFDYIDTQGKPCDLRSLAGVDASERCI